ncbi:hypothetical protein [Ilumatobacter sp.]|uniref:hypothetical protein n=1 Tax=Ilumatobacter sp. TaxID=1967498 RepID=UPI003B52BD35
MRQLLTWRLLAALGALVVLALGVDALVAGSEVRGGIAVDPATAVDVDADGEPLERTIDLVAAVERFELTDDFSIGDDRTTVGTMDAVLDAARVMHVAPGTPGRVACDGLGDEGSCVVLADLLGEAVVWFAVLPRGADDTVELPPVIDLQDGYAVFGNGWRVRYETVIERECDGQDVVNFSDFLRRFGPNSRTFVDLDTQKVTTVECGEEFVAPTTTVAEDGPLDGDLVVVTAPPPTTVVPQAPPEG